MRVAYASYDDDSNIDADVDVHNSAGPRKGRSHAVVESPYEGSDRIISWHANAAAAARAVGKYQDDFRRHNGSGAYGWSWTPAKVVPT